MTIGPEPAEASVVRNRETSAARPVKAAESTGSSAGAKNLADGDRRRRRRQRGIVDEDLLMHADQVRAGIDAQLRGEHLPRALVHRERVGPAAGAVQGEHELCPEPFVQRISAGQRLQIGKHLAVLAQCQPGLQRGVHDGRSQPLQPRRLASQRLGKGQSLQNRLGAPEAHGPGAPFERYVISPFG